MSLYPSSHDHAKFWHDYVKLIRIAVVWTILHHHANILHDYAKVILKTTIKWALWTTSQTYARILHVCTIFFFKICSKYKPLFHFAPLSENKPSFQNSSSSSDTRNWRGRRPSVLFPFHSHSLISLPCPKPRSNIRKSHYSCFFISKDLLEHSQHFRYLIFHSSLFEIAKWIRIEKFDLLWDLVVIFCEFWTNWYPLFQLSFNSLNCPL